MENIFGTIAVILVVAIIAFFIFNKLNNKRIVSIDKQLNNEDSLSQKKDSTPELENEDSLQIELPWERCLSR